MRCTRVFDLNDLDPKLSNLTPRLDNDLFTIRPRSISPSKHGSAQISLSPFAAGNGKTRASRPDDCPRRPPSRRLSARKTSVLGRLPLRPATSLLYNRKRVACAETLEIKCNTRSLIAILRSV